MRLHVDSGNVAPPRLLAMRSTSNAMAINKPPAFAPITCSSKVHTLGTIFCELLLSPVLLRSVSAPGFNGRFASLCLSVSSSLLAIFPRLFQPPLASSCNQPVSLSSTDSIKRKWAPYRAADPRAGIGFSGIIFRLEDSFGGDATCTWRILDFRSRTFSNNGDVFSESARFSIWARKLDDEHSYRRSYTQAHGSILE